MPNLAPVLAVVSNSARVKTGKKESFSFVLPPATLQPKRVVPVQEPGKFNLTFVVMPSCWLGCNATAAVPFTVMKQTAAEKAGKGPTRGKDKNAPRFLDADEVCLRSSAPSLAACQL